MDIQKKKVEAKVEAGSWAPISRLAFKDKPPELRTTGENQAGVKVRKQFRAGSQDPVQGYKGKACSRTKASY